MKTKVRTSGQDRITAYGLLASYVFLGLAIAFGIWGGPHRCVLAVACWLASGTIAFAAIWDWLRHWSERHN